MKKIVNSPYTILKYNIGHPRTIEPITIVKIIKFVHNTDIPDNSCIWYNIPVKVHVKAVIKISGPLTFCQNIPKVIKKPL